MIAQTATALPSSSLYYTHVHTSQSTTNVDMLLECRAIRAPASWSTCKCQSPMLPVACMHHPSAAGASPQVYDDLGEGAT